MATKTTYADRPIPKISLRDFDARIDEITAELCDASENVGFFALVDHGIPAAEIDAIFARSAAFFALPDEVKATVPWSPLNVGWEKMNQIRPSTGAPDTKESYQLQFGENMDHGGTAPGGSLWMSDEHLPGFRADCLGFMNRLHTLSKKLMICFARGLGFPDDYFLPFHDVSRPSIQSVLRLLHYFPIEPPAPDSDKPPTIYHRAGAHADWGFLTLLFQRPGQGGLEICPGREAVTEFGLGDTWTRVEPDTAAIVCNIGDLLMSWSDDRFKSTFHRVKAPCEPGDFYGERYSVAFFNQPCADAIIQGPAKKYPAVTGAQFTKNAMDRHFAALQAKRNAKEATTSTLSSVPAAA
ncbi:oxoglutarate/iron-dependent oxygenase [Grosmannia clavigera kw1407]|uniref:Oxoglutarate/iron-dependent oxygenase n=1 Tax=Grosmannia clavigera (strain kw1407 / UAMH 11150) TaxID=655863 RepID=F0XJL1_GROCL|nr:oxoglutarate/iron-dependent oxygenase [Grosmannia clavigera kw1407]EFX02175.1 oxoglutarate/iron-dependent oxygenase [Grosmannia clavigera kw1407]